MLNRAIVFGCLAVLGAAAAAADPGVAIDNSYFDWQDLPAIARFAERYSPYYFSREAGGTRETLTVDRSLYWNRGGTQIREIKGIIEGGSLYLYIGTETNLAPEVSIFGYIYVGRKPGEVNRYALELLPARRKDGGFVALWSRDGKATEAGELVNSSFSLECRIDLSKLPADLVSPSGAVSVDVTTCYREAASGTYEEFYFTTLYPADITVAP
jgi:hypothetical protein